MNDAEKISDAEAEIMKVIWSKSEPITYTEIRETLNKKFDIGSQSIQTMLKRLVNKNILKQEKREVYYYSALVLESDYIKSKTDSFVERVFDGNIKGLLTALADYKNVTDKDLIELQEFWKKARDADE